MKTIISGGSSDRIHRLAYRILDMLPITEVVSGGYSGIDKDGEEWAKLHGIPCTVFEANFVMYRSAAMPIRNAKMAAYADAILLFPEGPGKKSMYREAVKAKLRIFDFRGSWK